MLSELKKKLRALLMRMHDADIAMIDMHRGNVIINGDRVFMVDFGFSLDFSRLDKNKRHPIAINLDIIHKDYRPGFTFEEAIEVDMLKLDVMFPMLISEARHEPRETTEMFELQSPVVMMEEDEEDPGMYY